MLSVETIRSNIQSLAEKYHLTLVVLFGSQVTGKTHAHSDADVAFLSERELRMAEIGQMELDLSQILRTKDVDAVDLKTAAPLLLKNVSQNAVVLYESQPALFANFKIYAFKRYLEAKPLFDLQSASVKRFLHHSV